MLSYEETLSLIKAFIKKAKEEPQYYDQNRLKEIEDLIQDTNPQSIKDILQKSIDIWLDAMTNKGEIEKVKKNGGTYYDMSNMRKSKAFN